MTLMHIASKTFIYLISIYFDFHLFMQAAMKASESQLILSTAETKNEHIH